jgi:hypothetical protein
MTTSLDATGWASVLSPDIARRARPAESVDQQGITAVTAQGRTVYEDGPSGPLFGCGVREEYRVKLASRRLLTRGSGE